MGPGVAGFSAQSGNRFARRELPLNPGEIDARGGTERDPGPRPWIDVEELGATVAEVELEFQFGDAAIAQIGQEAERLRLDLAMFDRLDEGAGGAEIHRVLAGVARHQRG